MTGVYDIARDVLRWRDEGRSVTVARLLDGHGLAGRDGAPVAAWVEGGEPVGSPLAARAAGAGPSRVEVVLTDAQAEDVGLACGGSATVLVQDAADLPEVFWEALRRGDPVALVDHEGATTGFGADAVPEPYARFFGRGVSQVVEVADGTLTTYWPTTRVLVVGGGPVATALVAQSALLGWAAEVVDGVTPALDVLRGFGRADAVVVLSHDRAVDGPVLAAAAVSSVGYVGAMGSRHTQAARADWFAARGVTTGLERIHGPAGLAIGGYGPAEIALSITAEIVAVRSGAATD